MRRLFALCVFSVLLLSCAEPTYLTNSNPEMAKPQSQGEALCSVRLSQSELCLTWHWELEPTATEFGRFIFKTFRPNALDLSPVPVDIEGQATVVLWMPTMGHGSVPAHVEKVDIGSFRVSNVFFVMPGEWEIRIQFKTEDRLVDEAVISLHR